MTRDELLLTYQRDTGNPRERLNHVINQSANDTYYSPIYEYVQWLEDLILSVDGTD